MLVFFFRARECSDEAFRLLEGNFRVKKTTTTTKLHAKHSQHKLYESSLSLRFSLSSGARVKRGVASLVLSRASSFSLESIAKRR